MVRIELLNGYFIDQEPLNYTLKQKFEGRTKDDKPKESVRTIGYFGDLESAIKRFLKLNQLDENDGLSVDMKNHVNSIVAANDKACAEIMKLWGIQNEKAE